MPGGNVFTNSSVNASYLSDPRLALIQSLQQQGANAAPAEGGWGEGLARAFSGIVAGYQGKKLKSEYQAKDDDAKQRLTDALNSSAKREDRIKAVSAVPGYEDVAVKASLEKPDFDFGNLVDQAIIKKASGQPLTPEEEAAGRAYDLKKSAEVQMDTRGVPYTPYRPMFGGAAAPAPGSNGTLQLSRDGTATLLPPPVQGQPQDPSVVAGMGNTSSTTPQAPAGLDPKAQGVFMDQVAKQQAENAMNGGTPVLTEPQGKANSRATLLADGLSSFSKLLGNKNIDPVNMAIADTVSYGGPLGQVGANKIRSPEEQSWSAARDKALESVASAVTGAGVTKEQFARFSNLLPNGSEDPAVQREKLISAYGFLRAQTEEAGPASQDIRSAIDSQISNLKSQIPQAAKAADLGIPPDVLKQAGEGGVIQGPDGKQYVVKGDTVVPK